MKQRTALLLMIGLLPWTEIHAQQPSSATFRVSARVEAECAMKASDFAFGKGDTSVRRTALLRATCTPNSSYSIGFDEGASHDTVTGVGTGFSQDHTVAGVLPAPRITIYY